jgi:hypothetical protein
MSFPQFYRDPNSTKNNISLDVYDSNGGQTTTSATGIVVNLDSGRIVTEGFTFDPLLSEATIASEGNFIVAFRASTAISSGSSRSTSKVWLELDTGSGFTEVDGATAYMYNRTSGAADNSGSGFASLFLSVGDKLRLKVARTAGSDTIELLPNGSSLVVFSLTGAKGDRGQKGTSVLSGAVPPTSIVGVEGDFYIDTNTNFIYGPKNNEGEWGSSTALASGPQGPQGEAGLNGYGVFAYSKTASNGNVLDARGFTVSRTSLGTYEYVFTTATPDTNYTVANQIFNLSNNTDTNVFINNTTTTGFTVTIGVGDNSGTPDVLVDAEHSITVFGFGGPSGITSAYESWLGLGNTGTEQDFIDSLVGPQGPQGDVSEFETTTQLNTRDVNNRNRSNHTGTQLSSTISDFASTVRATILTGLSTATGTIVSATDSILVAIGKLQRQITDKVYGNNFQFAEILPEVTTTSSTYQQRLRLTTTSLPLGNYKIEWSSDIGADDNDQAQARIQINDSITLGEVQVRINTDGDPSFVSFSGHAILSSISGVQNFDIDYRGSGTGTNTARIKNVRMNIIRVS